MRRALAALLLLASTASPAVAAERKGDPGAGRAPAGQGDRLPCRIQVGPRDRVAQDGDLIVPAGADVESAVALRGSVVVQRGARVRNAVSAGGSVRVEAGGRIAEDAVALGGDVRVDADGRVDGDAVALGGQVRIAEGGRVGGHVTGLSLQLAGVDLERELRQRLLEEGKCRVEPE